MRSRRTRSAGPGPGHYAVRDGGGFGLPPPVRVAAAAATAGVGFLSRARRPSLALPSYGPGAVYRHQAACGRQVTSTRPSAPRALMGTSSREHAALQYTTATYKPA